MRWYEFEGVVVLKSEIKFSARRWAHESSGIDDDIKGCVLYLSRFYALVRISPHFERIWARVARKLRSFNVEIGEESMVFRHLMYGDGVQISVTAWHDFVHGECLCV